MKTVKEGGDLLKGPSNGEVINVRRDSEVAEVMGSIFKDGL